MILYIESEGTAILVRIADVRAVEPEVNPMVCLGFHPNRDQLVNYNCLLGGEDQHAAVLSVRGCDKRRDFVVQPEIWT